MSNRNKQQIPNPSDLSDGEWESIQEIIPASLKGGRPPKYTRREIVNAILYVLATKISWRSIPDEYPPWNTIFVYYNRWRKDGSWAKAAEVLQLETRGSNRASNDR